MPIFARLGLGGNYMGFNETSIILVARCKYDQQVHVYAHSHDFFHIVYIVGGDGTLKIGNIFRKSIENDIYIIKPGVYHEFTSNPSNPMRTIEVKFNTDDVVLKGKMDELFDMVNSRDIKVKTVFENLVEEALNKELYSKEIITVSLYRVVFLLMREQKNEKYIHEDMMDRACQISEKTMNNRLDDKVLAYIHSNYHKKILLWRLANIMAINQSYLCKTFVKKYGITPVQYINDLRLQKAKELLTYTELNVTEISEKVGFQSIHYFSRYFTNRMRISPIEYKHRIKECVYITVEDRYNDVYVTAPAQFSSDK